MQIKKYIDPRVNILIRLKLALSTNRLNLNQVSPKKSAVVIGPTLFKYINFAALGNV